MQSLTITPEDVRAATGQPGTRPSWLDAVAEYVQRAAADGELVTLTAKRRIPSGFRTIWSRTAEQEALRHMPARAVSPAAVRRRFGGTLGPTGDVDGGFDGTARTGRGGHLGGLRSTTPRCR